MDPGGIRRITQDPRQPIAKRHAEGYSEKVPYFKGSVPMDFLRSSKARLWASLPLAALALQACESRQSTTVEPQPQEQVPSSLARVSGTVGQATGTVRIHVFEGDDQSKESRVVLSGDNGDFRLDVQPGDVRLFLEKDGEKAQQIYLDQLMAGAVSTLDTVRLAQLLSGTIAIPGLADASISARVEGSPLTVTRDGSGGFVVKAVSGGESILILSFATNGVKTELRFRIRCTEEGLRIERMESRVLPPPPPPVQTGTDSLVLRPSPDEVQETEVLGNFSGSSTWRQFNFGKRPAEGLGGAYDGNTIGRHLWRWSLPDSLKERRILSAKLVFTPVNWNNRPAGGQDLNIEVFKMLRPWLEGEATGQGSPVTSQFDGANAVGPRYGQTWSMPLIGFDGEDAESIPVDAKSLPYLSMQPMSFDITAAVLGWLDRPSTNFGLVFRSTHELDGTYLDYPAFAVDDHPDVAKRPYLVIQLGAAQETQGAKTLTLQPGPDGQDDAMVIGTFTGNGSHDGNNQGTVSPEGLGGAWDANTVGRLLWRISLPDSLRGKEIVSAKAVFQVSSWIGRPVSGHDLKINAHRMLRSWKEGSGVFPGVANSTSIDGATSLGPSFEKRWNRPLVGLDGVDAQAQPSSGARLVYGSTDPIEFDFTELTKIWQADPASNQGVVFRSLEEMHPAYPNYPGFHMSETENSSRRPKLVIVYR